jgi:LysR family transcriptional regulator, glycine cleavage system transcriptional activator
MEIRRCAPALCEHGPDRGLGRPATDPRSGVVKRGQIPSIGELTSFVTAAQHGSFTRAADELNLTQGAVSRQIRLLESQLGVKLFERIRQRVVLTDAGKLYLPHVQEALTDLEAATRKVVSFSESTVFNLAVLPTFATRWLIPKLPDFQSRHPDVTIHLTTRQRPVDFSLELFDAAISYGSPNWPGTITHHLMDVAVVPVCSPQLHKSRRIKSPADIVPYPLLHQMSRPTRWAEWMTEAGVKLTGSLSGPTYEQFSMIAQAAVAGMGVALLPLFLIEDELADGRLEVVSDQSLATKTSYYLVVPESRVSSSAVKAFSDWLIGQARQTAGASDAVRIAGSARPRRRP